MKFVELSSVFKYTWEQVAIGLWQRYPNPNSSHVLSEDVISRCIDDDKIITRRLLTKTNSLPKWGERIVGKNSTVYIVEESVVDRRTKTIITYTRNVGMQKLMSIEEKCVYNVSPDNQGWTVCERSAWICSQLFGLSRPLEMFGIKRFTRNAQKAYLGFDYVLTGLFRPDYLREHPLVSNKIRETARRAAEIAKSKAKPPQIIGRASASS